MAGEAVPIIYDTDLGEDIDDLYALYLALFHPRIKVLAVTTVHGDTQAKARLAAKVLRLAGFPQVPVGAGISMSEARIQRGQASPDPRRSAAFLEYVMTDDPEWGETYPDAEQVISQVLKGADESVALVGEGAYSNLAQAVCNPRLRGQVRCVAVMGGETQRVMSEYNVYCDPEAADVVFTCGLPVFMATFDLTARLRMSMAEVEEHFGRDENPVHRVLHECTEIWLPRHGKSGPVLYDLVPVFWLADEGCVETRRSTIRVELEGTYTRGQTVRIHTSEPGPVLESTNLDPDKMLADFLRLMDSAGPASSASQS